METDSSSDEESPHSTILVRRNQHTLSKTKLDRNFLLTNVKKHMRVEGLKSVSNFDESVFLEDADEYCGEKSGEATSTSQINVSGNAAYGYDEEGEELASDGKRIGKRKKKKRRGVKRGSEEVSESGEEGSALGENEESSGVEEEIVEDEETSIFGQTAGSANATWVECDRCKKVSLVQHSDPHDFIETKTNDIHVQCATISGDASAA